MKCFSFIPSAFMVLGIFVCIFYAQLMKKSNTEEKEYNFIQNYLFHNKKLL